VLGRGVHIGQGAEIVESVIMDYAEIGAGVKLREVIVDRFNVVPAGTEIGAGLGNDDLRFFRDPSGLIVLERGETR
jgi:glucose-1-phosphate adenylyltransferase